MRLCTINSYVLGSAIRAEARLEDGDNNPLAADTLRCLYSGPGDTTSTVSATVVVPATETDAEFAYAIITPDREGEWRYRWETTAGVAAAAEAVVKVLPRTVPVPA